MLPLLPKRSHLALIGLLFATLMFGVYGPSLRNEFVTLDDPGLITENPIVASINATTLKLAFTSYDPELYIPLTFVSYQIDHLIGGFQPFMYHFTNLLLHTVNAILVTWFLFLLLENGWLALGLGMIFSVHTLNSEAVLWASARKDVLSTLFFLLSLLAYVYASDRKSGKIFWLSVFLFLLGLLSKVMIVTLPVILLLLDDIRGRKVDRRMLLEKIPYIIIACIFGVIGIFGKTENLVSSTFFQKILMAAKSTMFYVGKFFWPTDLSITYPYTNPITVLSSDFAVSLILTMSLLLFAAFIRQRSRITSFAILFFLITLMPTFLNFAKGGDVYFASDRYAYIPMIGLLLLAGIIADHWFRQALSVRSIASRRMVLSIGTLCILAALSVLSLRQSAIWSSSRSLYEHALALYPKARAAQNNLGMEQMMAGEIDDAIASFRRALALHPDPKTRINLAAAFVRKGNLTEAEEIFRDIMKTNPEIADSFYGLGQIYQKQGRLPEAASWYRRAIEIDPMYGNAYNNLGGVYLQLKDWRNAEAVLRKSVELKPDFVESMYNLAIALKQMSQRDESETLFRKVLETNPDDPDALANLAELLYDRSAIDEAAQALKKVFAIDQNNPTAFALLLRMKKDGIVR